jgi:hypothetical protein
MKLHAAQSAVNIENVATNTDVIACPNGFGFNIDVR